VLGRHRIDAPGAKSAVADNAATSTSEVGGWKLMHIHPIIFTLLVALSTVTIWTTAERYKLIPPQVTMQAEWLGEEMQTKKR